MRSLLNQGGGYASKQRGVVLFFALIALVVMSLAAVALIRSVDTNTLIAGNLAFKEAAVTSGDAGTEAAVAWLTTTQAANSAKNIYTDNTHAFNVTNAANGYYADVNSSGSLTDGTGIQWTAADSASAGTDGSGNTMRYVIQRMCRGPLPATPPYIATTSCLFSSATLDTNGQNIRLPQDICTGSGCPVAGQAPVYRVTARITGPRNTISYIQAFVY